MTNILFVYFNQDYRPRTSLSLSILETIVKNAGHNTIIFDTSFYPESLGMDSRRFEKAGIRKSIKNLSIPLKTPTLYKDFKNTILKFKPDIIAFTFYSLNSGIQHKLLTPIRKEFPNIPVLAGGPQPSINPDRCLVEEPYIDYICCGEGEDFMMQVCDRLDKKESLQGIQGLWYREQGKIQSGGVAKMFDLDKLPPQNLDSYDPVQMYGLFEGHAYRMGHVEFTRGCPYDCSYCGAGSIRKLYAGEENTGGYVRSRDPKLAVLEYKMLKEKYNLDLFYFIDGTFLAMPRKKLKELVKLYKEEVNLPFIALVHPNTIKEETASLLAEMGCVHVSVGLESGIADYRSSILNRKMSNKTIVKSIQLLRAKGIHVSAYNIIGAPGMDRKHVFDTIQLNRDSNPHSSIVSIFIPYLDNDMTKNLIRDGLLDPDKIVVKNGVEPTVEINEMTAAEITGLFNTFNIYLKAPKWLYPAIKFLEKDSWYNRFLIKRVYEIIKLLTPKARITPKRKIKMRKHFYSLSEAMS